MIAASGSTGCGSSVCSSSGTAADFLPRPLLATVFLSTSSRISSSSDSGLTFDSSLDFLLRLDLAGSGAIGSSSSAGSCLAFLLRPFFFSGTGAGWSASMSSSSMAFFLLFPFFLGWVSSGATSSSSSSSWITFRFFDDDFFFGAGSSSSSVLIDFFEPFLGLLGELSVALSPFSSPSAFFFFGVRLLMPF